MVYSQWNHKVQALPPQRADEPLAEGIRLRALRRRFEHLQAQVTYMLVKLRGENAVPVMDQKTVAMVGWQRFAQLLERPSAVGWAVTLQCRIRRVACSISTNT